MSTQGWWLLFVGWALAIALIGWATEFAKRRLFEWAYRQADEGWAESIREMFAMAARRRQ